MSFWSSIFPLVICCIFVFLGTMNTLLLKFENENYSKDCTPAPPFKFSQPTLQTFFWFLGMTFFTPFLWGSYSLNKCRGKKADNRGSNEKPANQFSILLLFPAFCDIFGSMLLLYGLVLTWASVYQMLNSLKIFFTAIMSFLFLKRRMYPHHIIGLTLLVMAGILVSLSSVVQSAGQEAPNPVLGILVILAGEVLKSVKFIFEELVLIHMNFTPLYSTVVEGIFGFTLITLFLFITYFIPTGSNGGRKSQSLITDAPRAFCQIGNSGVLLTLVILQTFNMGTFNYFSMKMTKLMGATIRCIIDELRIIGVWAVQLARRREKFQWMQFSGFVLLVLGTMVYNRVLRVPFYDKVLRGWVSEKGEYYPGIFSSAKKKMMKRQGMSLWGGKKNVINVDEIDEVIE